MPTVTLTFTTLPEHVRTARLVAAAVARRRGLTEDVLDEIRLAVGEACASAVGRAQSAGRQGTVHVQIFERPDRLVVVVNELGDAGSPASDAAGGAAGEAVGAAEQVSLTIVRALADEVETVDDDNSAAGITDESLEPEDDAHAAPTGGLRLVWHL
ncbi:MAG TPA: ATP-binding protein [Actinomycetales bacterium]|nr:ATP-binding protein [Actinomycetales bacterium]